MFQISENAKGFKLTFSNDWTVSVQFASYNLCSNYGPNSNGEYGAATAEIAAWYGEDYCEMGLDSWYAFSSGDHWDDKVQGYSTPDQVTEFLNLVSNFPARRLTGADYCQTCKQVSSSTISCHCNDFEEWWQLVIP